MSCSKCEPFDGKWQLTEKGMKRCDCVAGVELAAVDRARKEGRSDPPVLSSGEATLFVEMLAGALKFFPAESGARLMVAGEIQRMCRSVSEADWLVRRMGRLYEAWPGVRELRIVYCSKHRPLDGGEMLAVSAVYPDGIPSETSEPHMLPAGKGMSALPPGHVVSAVASVDAVIQDLAIAKDIRNVGKVHRVRDIPILPQGQRVTQADIDAAVFGMRDRRARAELGSEG